MQVNRWDSANDQTIDIFTAKNYLGWNPIDGWERIKELDLDGQNFFVLRDDVFKSEKEAQRAMITKIFEKA